MRYPVTRSMECVYAFATAVNWRLCSSSIPGVTFYGVRVVVAR